MKRRHLTPKEICEQCKAVAREARMADRSPWTAMGIISAYTLLKSEGFKGSRIVKVINAVNDMEQAYIDEKLKVEDVSKQLMDKAGWSIEHVEYTEADIRAKKGSFKYWLDMKQIDPQNRINKMATRYMLFMFKALMDEYGYGKERLTRVQEKMNALLQDYQVNKVSVGDWKKEVFDETGLVFEAPIDPLTQTKGSIMSGG